MNTSVINWSIQGKPINQETAFYEGKRTTESTFSINSRRTQTAGSCRYRFFAERDTRILVYSLMYGVFLSAIHSFTMRLVRERAPYTNKRPRRQSFTSCNAKNSSENYLHILIARKIQPRWTQIIWIIQNTLLPGPSLMKILPINQQKALR